MKTPKRSSSPPDAEKAISHKRILIVEDHPLMREGIVKWISRHDPELEVCGEAADAPEGLQAAEKLKPDLVLCDISLPTGNGIELAKDLHALDPELPVIMLSMHQESIYALRALRAGARGYVMKEAGGSEVVEAVREVLAGGTAFSRHVTGQAMAELAGRDRGHQSPLSALTDREFEVMCLFGEGKTTREIAEHLRISPKTVGTHRTNICHKLGIKSTPELLLYAMHHLDAESEN